MTAGRIIERTYPYLGGVAALVVERYAQRLPAISNAKELLAATVSVAGVLVGFAMTATSILCSVSDKPLARTLATTDTLALLVGYMTEATMLALVLMAGSAAVLAFVIDSTGAAPAHWVATAWVATNVAVWLAVFRVVHLMRPMVRSGNGA